MRTSLFARVALLTLGSVLGGCGTSTTVTPIGGDTDCKIDSDCPARYVCINQKCYYDPREMDMSVEKVDFAKEYVPIDFSAPPGSDLSNNECQPGTKKCGVINGNIPKCIPNAWCCINNDCTAAGQTCQLDGSCACPLGFKACLQTCIPNANCCTNDDCPSKLCVSGTCAVPQCADGVPNGNETDVDCGGGFCGKCLAERACGLAIDCRSNICTSQVCKEPGFTKAPYGGGTNPAFIRTGDFNGDGNADLITLDSNGTAVTGSQNLSVLLGLGNGSFQSIGSFATGLGPVNADIADLNGDKRLDVVVANKASNTISVLLGAGDGTFLTQKVYNVGSTPVWIAIGDQNKDNRKDILVVNNFTNSIGLMLGNGDGTFKTMTQTFTFITRPASAVMADFDKDGYDDVAVQTVGSPPVGTVGFTTGAISVYLTDPVKGTFKAPTHYATSSTLLTALTAGDLNGDGTLDLMVGSASSIAPQVFRGGANGTFQLAGALAAAIYTPYAAFADLNGDKILDLISSSGAQLGNGNGSFQANVAYDNAGAGITSIAVADYNKDGKLDIAYPVPASNYVNMIQGNGDGTFNKLSLVAPFSGSQTDVLLESPRVTNLTDLNGDGRADLLVASGTGNLVTAPGLFVHIANANGTLQLPSVYAIGTAATPSGIATGDFNNDKNIDVVVTNSSEAFFYLLTGNANGTLNPAVKLPSPLANQTAAAGDLDADGNLDLILATTGNQVYYFLGKGDGTFKPAVGLTVNNQPRQILLYDWNADKNLDIITVNRGSSNLSWLISKGLDMNMVLQWNAAINQAPPGMPAPAPIAAGIADLNGDNLPDLVIADNSTNAVRSYLNITMMNGALTFAMPKSYLTLAIPTSAVMADFDGDGKMDFATANNTDRSVSLFLGKGMGDFSQMINYDVGIGPVWITAGDVNGDKKPDLATANQTAGTATVLLNTGTFN